MEQTAAARSPNILKITDAASLDSHKLKSQTKPAQVLVSRVHPHATMPVGGQFAMHDSQRESDKTPARAASDGLSASKGRAFPQMSDTATEQNMAARRTQQVPVQGPALVDAVTRQTGEGTQPTGGDGGKTHTERFRIQAEAFDVGGLTRFGSTLGKKPTIPLDETGRKWIYGKAPGGDVPGLGDGDGGAMRILNESGRGALRIQDGGESQRHFNNYSLLSLIRESTTHGGGTVQRAGDGQSKAESLAPTDLTRGVRGGRLEGLEDKKPIITKISATHKDGSIQADLFDSQLVSNATTIREMPLFPPFDPSQSRSSSPLQRLLEDQGVSKAKTDEERVAALRRIVEHLTGPHQPTS
jgi:hypothetical protein